MPTCRGLPLEVLWWPADTIFPISSSIHGYGLMDVIIPDVDARHFNSPFVMWHLTAK